MKKSIPEVVQERINLGTAESCYLLIRLIDKKYKHIMVQPYLSRISIESLEEKINWNFTYINRNFCLIPKAYQYLLDGNVQTYICSGRDEDFLIGYEIIKVMKNDNR